MSRAAVRFLRRGEAVELHAVDPNETLLDYLRLREGSRGTKEGCAEGDCGACTVALGTLRGGRVIYEPVNSCIQLLGMVDGKEVVVVDDLADSAADLHPVQQAMVDHHGSQCGFCTPGLVMSLFTLYHAGVQPERAQINDWLAGNLCRCTGYRPIVDAAVESCTGQPNDRYIRRADQTLAQLSELNDGADVFVGDSARFFASPASMDSLADLYARYPDAHLVAGATDVGLWITKQLRDLPRVIWLGRVAGLDNIDEDSTRVVIGAGATYAQAESALSAIDPDVGELIRRLGSKQVRAAGTVGGNVANGSPIGDCPPVLIALETTVSLRAGHKRRELPLEAFFVDYGKQDRQPGEFVSHLVVPKLAANQQFRCYKIAKRFDQDISALLGAYLITVEDNRIVAVRVAYGGMAATPKRATFTENALTGLSLADDGDWDRADEALALDFQPISDMRASADYRLSTARALLRKALTAHLGEPSTSTRVIGLREHDVTTESGKTASSPRRGED